MQIRTDLAGERLACTAAKIAGRLRKALCVHPCLGGKALGVHPRLRGKALGVHPRLRGKPLRIHPRLRGEALCVHPALGGVDHRGVHQQGDGGGVGDLEHGADDEFLGRAFGQHRLVAGREVAVGDQVIGIVVQPHLPDGPAADLGGQHGFGDQPVGVLRIHGDRAECLPVHLVVQRGAAFGRGDRCTAAVAQCHLGEVDGCAAGQMRGHLGLAGGGEQHVVGGHGQ